MVIRLTLRPAFCWLTVLTFAGGCATTSEETASQAPALPAMPPDYAEALLEAQAVAEAAPVTPEPEEAQENLEQGFCRDDIYARYLISVYERENPLSKRLARYRSRQSREAARRYYEYDALHFANRRLNGSVAPYFGAIPIVVNERVEFWINHFKKRGRREFMRWLVRAESMRDLVNPVLQEHGIPQEFFYLAMVESGFNHLAYSKARATGPWQFMLGTAHLYGLRIDHWVDERRDPLRSTVAAANYLKDLYAELGDWYLAMAAYNSGPGRVRSAIRRGRTRDFWELADKHLLPNETRHYVPKVLAAVLLATDPKAHGFDVKANPADRLPDTTLTLTRPVALDELARELGVSVSTIQAWNPELIRGITPPRRDGYALRLPEELIARFSDIESRLSTLEVTEVHMHRIRPGDTLSQLARRYKVKIKQILSVNPGLKPTALRIGKSIAIPIPGVVTKKSG